MQRVCVGQKNVSFIDKHTRSSHIHGFMDVLEKFDGLLKTAVFVLLITSSQMSFRKFCEFFRTATFPKPFLMCSPYCLGLLWPLL